MEPIKISRQLELFCTDYITALGGALDIVIRVNNKEYEAGFNEAMNALSKGWLNVPGKTVFQCGVLEEDRPRMLAEIKLQAELGGIPYNNLSPLNQFMATIPPYIFYCLKKYLQNNPSLLEEASRLMNTDGFPRYLQKEIGMSIAQEIKGALWRPNLFGMSDLLDYVSGLKNKESRKQGEQVASIIKGLNLILENIFWELVCIYRTEYPNDKEETNFHRAGCVLNELVIEELRGEQIAFKEQNVNFINKEKIRLLKLEKIRKDILSFLTAKGAFYSCINSPKAIIWINGAKELEPNIIIPNSLDKIIDIINTYITYINNLADTDK